MKINLTANNANEQRVLDYLEANASDVLAEKINTGKKTLNGFFAYARGEAQKLAVNGCACVEDQTVFGWAIHYFEEEEIKEPTAGAASDGTTAVNTEPKAEPKAQAKPIAAKKEASTVKPCKKGKAKDDSQMSIFDMRGFKRYRV